MTIEEMYTLYKKHPVVCTDSRAITANCLFFALKGDNFNGNTFAETALKQGASYAVIDEPALKKDERFILVDDALKALQQLANYHRKQLNCPVLAITGSNGKTTTKELISKVLSKKFKTHFTQGNLNNHIGVPLTILSAPADTEMLVVEMGANHQKEIEMLCNIAEPDYGIITNVGKAHLEGFGSFEGVQKAKGELYDFLAAHNGLAFANVDNEFLAGMISKTGVQRVISYGKSFQCECEGKLTATNPFLSLLWKYDSRKGKAQTHIIGEYNFENILAAICIGNYFEVESSAIDKAIEEYVPGNNRSQLVKKGTNTIILDAYNANPMSMAAALNNFAAMKDSPKIVFLGEMSELGSDTETEHKTILSLLIKLNFEKVILVGKKFNFPSENLAALFFNSSSEATAWAKEQRFHDSLILIKGSRSTRMEVIAESL